MASNSSKKSKVKEWIAVYWTYCFVPYSLITLELYASHCKAVLHS